MQMHKIKPSREGFLYIVFLLFKFKKQSQTNIFILDINNLSKF